jgi:fumarate reductase subunit D
MAIHELEKAVKGAGSWFYWVAALSVINTIITLFHGKMAFVVGLGATQILDAAIQEYGTTAAAIVIPVNLVIAGVYALFGYFACQRQRWAFIVGMIFYALDGLLMVVAASWLGLAFHAYVLWAVSRGLRADSAARQLEAQARYTIS